MQTLEQTLSEVEPILREVDGRFSFSHPSFQEVLTARQFADEINSGKLSVRDAYVNFWSYDEINGPSGVKERYADWRDWDLVWMGLIKDKRLWDSEKLADNSCKILLPAWRNVLLYMAGILESDKAQELMDIINENYLKCKQKFYENLRIKGPLVSYPPVTFLKHMKRPERQYHLSYDDLFFVASFIGASKNRGNLKTEIITKELIEISWFWDTRETGDKSLVALADIGDNEAIDFLVRYIQNKVKKEDFLSERDAQLIGFLVNKIRYNKDCIFIDSAINILEQIGYNRKNDFISIPQQILDYNLIICSPRLKPSGYVAPKIV